MKILKETRRIFERAVEEYVAPALMEQGFRQNKFSIFYKQHDSDCLWRVWVYFQDVRGADEASVFTTVSVGFRSITEFLSKWPIAPLDTDIKKPCTMAAHMGYLRPPFNSDPIRLTPEDDADELGKALWQDIHHHGLPYFERFGTLEKAFAAWKQGTFFNSSSVRVYLLAAAHFLRGEKSVALQLVDAEIGKEKTQIAAGSESIRPTTLPKDISDLLNIRYDVIANRTLTELVSFREFLVRMG